MSDGIRLYCLAALLIIVIGIALDSGVKFAQTNAQYVSKMSPLLINTTISSVVLNASITVTLSSGVVILHIRNRTVAKDFITRAITPNVELQQSIIQCFGMDFFYMRLSGPEVVARTSRVVDSTSQTLFYINANVHVTGVYNIAIYHLHSLFQALQELNDVWPVMTLAPVVQLHHYLQGAGACTPGWRARNVDTVQKYLGHKHFLDPTQAFAERTSMLSNTLFWETCSNYDYTVRNVETCLDGKHLRFVGDSHMRKFATAVATRYNSSWVGSDARWHGDTLDMSTASINITFVKNVMGDPFPESNAVTVFNFGNHAASSLHHTFTKYRGSVETLWQHIHTFNTSKLIWHETNPIPLRKDSYVKQFKDWRTLARIELFNNFTTSFFRSKGVTILESFNILLPLLDLSSDNAHWHDTPGMHLIVSNFLNMLCNPEWSEQPQHLAINSTSFLSESLLGR